MAGTRGDDRAQPTTAAHGVVLKAAIIDPTATAVNADARRSTWPATITSVIWFLLALPTVALVQPADLESMVGLPALVIGATIVSLFYWGIARLLVNLGGRVLRARR